MSGRGASFGEFGGKTAYAVLGVEPGASDEVIKKAFRVAVKRFHPSGQTPNSLLYDHAVQAKELLSDPEKRHRLDVSLGIVDAGNQTTGAWPIGPRLGESLSDWFDRTATAEPASWRQRLGPRYLDLVGQRGWHRFGFRLPSPFDRLTVPAGQSEGDILFPDGDDSGLFPSDLIVRYRWPTRGFIGEHRTVTVHRSARHRWQPFRFKTEDGVVHNIEPAEWRAEPVLSGYGEPGEFNGPRGNLVLHVEYHGKGRSQKQQQRRDRGWLGRWDRTRQRLEHPLTGR